MILRLGAVVLLTSLALAAVASEARGPTSRPDPGPDQVAAPFDRGLGTLDLPALIASPLHLERSDGHPADWLTRARERAEVRDRLATKLDVLGADVGVAVLDVESGEELAAGEARVLGASTIKVDILATLLREQDGRLERSQRALVRSMITVSDNAATDAVLQEVGGADAVNAFNADAGLEQTLLQGERWGRTRTTATDRLDVLRAVLGPDPLIDRRAQRTARSLMTDVADDQRVGVNAAADDPDATPLKAGYLEDDRTGRWHVSSMGEVRAGGRDYLVAVVSERNRTLDEGIERVERAARAAVEHASALARTDALRD